ncbi:MAG: SDR family oxidoreductase [Phycisphaerales bacterium]|nr:SDR family oxidoreductase [Phycisphaerales bacterium]
MNLSLSGKRALVCGSTQGIGRACAVELANLGASITLMARDEARLHEVAAALPPPATTGQKHLTLVADFTQPEQVRRAVHSAINPFDPILIVVNNTGGPAAGQAIDAAPEAFLAAFNAHVINNQLIAQATVPAMKTAGYGRIINIISTSVKQPIPNLGVSNTIRAAVASWAKTLSAELGSFGITVNNVLPGYTKTERLTSLVKGRAAKQATSEDAISRELISSIPAGRFGEAEEIAAAVAFLASPAAAYINGINLPVDGGRLGSL